jgi:hypothetical protein
MRILIVRDAEESGSSAEEGEPEGFPFLFIRRVGLQGLVLPLPQADLHVLPAPFYLELEAASCPNPVFAQGREVYIAEAFAKGCADFLRSPWGIPELAARAGRFWRIRLRLEGEELMLAGRTISSRFGGALLTEGEYRLFRILALNLAEPVPRGALLMTLYGCETEASRAADVHISALRHKISMALPGGGRAIEACRGRGYRLVAEACG